VADGVTFEYGDAKEYGFLKLTVGGRADRRLLHRRPTGHDARRVRCSGECGEGHLLDPHIQLGQGLRASTGYPSWDGVRRRSC
jgi:hypothetical protein